MKFYHWLIWKTLLALIACCHEGKSLQFTKFQAGFPVNQICQSYKINQWRPICDYPDPTLTRIYKKMTKIDEDGKHWNSFCKHWKRICLKCNEYEQTSHSIHAISSTKRTRGKKGHVTEKLAWNPVHLFCKSVFIWSFFIFKFPVATTDQLCPEN